MRERLRQTFGQYAQGEQLENMLAQYENDKSGLTANLRSQIVKLIHAGLLMNKIMVDEKLLASDDDIEHENEHFAKDSNSDIAEVKKYYEEPQAREYLADQVKQKKAYALLLEKNTINIEKTVKFLDLFSKK
jgi:trigger factor